MKMGNHALQQRQLRLAHTLQKVGALLTATLSLEEVFEELFTLLAEPVAYNSASLQLYDGSGRRYLAAGRGFDDLEKVRRVVSSFLRSGQKIIERHGGKIVVSGRPGQSAVFHVCLPAMAREGCSSI